jgi:tetratricopeptide (TPR) repeat protein
VRAVLEDEAGLSRELLAEALGAHAIALRHLERYEEAIADIDRAVEIGQLLPIERATTLFYAGIIYWEGGRREGVIERLDQALALIPVQAASPLTANIRKLRGDIFAEQGDLVAAEREYDLAASHAKTLRRHVLFEQDRFYHTGRFGSIAEERAHLLLRQQRFADAFAAIEAAKSPALAERLGLGDLHPPRDVPADIREQERQLLETARQLEQPARGRLGQAAQASRHRIHEDDAGIQPFA